MASATVTAQPGTFAGTAWSWITTVDHKRIAVLYLVTALSFFVLGGVEALLLRLQLSRPELDIVDPNRFSELFTMHGTTMVFLALMPLSAAFFNLLVPLMIGARDVAFPRLNALSYWVYLFGGIFINISFVAGGAPDAGWFGYAPLTELPFAATHANRFLGARAPDPGRVVNLGLDQLHRHDHQFPRAWHDAEPNADVRLDDADHGFLIIFAFPVITVALVLLLFDRMLGTSFYLVIGGGDAVLWQHMFWVFGHPEVYILILPAMGIVSEILPTFARKPLFGYAVVAYSGAAIALVGFGVWTHHMFTVGLARWRTRLSRFRPCW